MGQPKLAASRTELIEYAVDILTEALQEGYVEPITLIECVHNASKPTVLAAARAVSVLSPSDQLQVVSFAQGLSGKCSGLENRFRSHLVS